MTGNGYLHWSKVHRRVRYELTNSGVPSAGLDDIGASSSPVDLIVRGSYGHPALVKKIASINRVEESRVVPVLGASCGIFLSMGATLTRGDRVALESPCYDPAIRSARFLGTDVLPIVRDPNQRFRVQLHEIQAHLEAGVRAVFLTNLHNPSGQLTNRETMSEIAHLCLCHQATLIVDEVYLDAAHLNLGQPRWSAALLGDNVMAINSLTKVYGLGGIRVGWIVASEATANRVRQLVNLINGDNPAPSEGLALKAFSRLGVLEERFRGFYRRSQPVYRAWLAAEPLLEGYPSAGAIFEALKLPQGVSAFELNERLVADYDTQVVPGSFFGLDDHIRMTIAIPPEDLGEALGRISRAIRAMLE